MKSIVTKNLLLFVLAAFVLAVLFRFSLSELLENEYYNMVFIPAILYAGAMFCAGWYFGKRDDNYFPINDIGFRFHFVTYLVHNGVSELWFLFGLESQYENVKTVHWTAITWGIFLLIHFFIFLWMRKQSIGNLDKENLFE